MSLPPPPPHSHPFKKKIKVNDDTWLNLVLWYCLGYMAEVLISCEGENVCRSLSPVFLFVFVLVSATPLNGLLYLGHKCIYIVHAPTIIGHVHICKKFFDFMIFLELCSFWNLCISSPCNMGAWRMWARSLFLSLRNLLSFWTRSPVNKHDNPIYVHSFN